jgi:hypothetical protein
LSEKRVVLNGVASKEMESGDASSRNGRQLRWVEACATGRDWQDGGAANNISQWKEQPHPHTLRTFFLNEKPLQVLAAMIACQNCSIRNRLKTPVSKENTGWALLKQLNYYNYLETTFVTFLEFNTLLCPPHPISRCILE